MGIKYCLNINIIYSSFRKMTLQFVSGCYIFIRCIELILFTFGSCWKLLENGRKIRKQIWNWNEKVGKLQTSFMEGSSYLNENVRDLGDFVHEARFLSVCVLLVNIRRRRFYLNQPMSGQPTSN